MQKKILLIGYNFYPELTGIGKYSGEMINWLASRGYDCTVITTYPYYPHWRIQPPYYEDRFNYKTEVRTYEGGGRLTVYRCPAYIPSSPSGMKRIALDASFLISAFFKSIYLLFKYKFDFTFTVAPSFQFGLLGILFKKIQSSTFIYHVQDMQIEAARDLHMIKSPSVINFLFKVEAYIFKQSDVISSISKEMVARIEEKAHKRVNMFPNWSDISSFFPIVDKGEIKLEFGFNKSDIIILYSGAIGEKQGLEAVLHAAKEFRANKNLKFIICGSGPYKDNLQSLSKAMGTDNVIFLPLQPLNIFNKFLNLADVHLVIQKNTASDLVMPSKLTSILAVGGLCIITANVGSGLHTLVMNHNIGILAQAEDQTALNKSIEKAITGNNQVISTNARLYAQNYLSIDSIMESFEKEVLVS